jgi:hypothetical protein
MNIINRTKEYIRQTIYPFTLEHLLYLLAFTIATTVFYKFIFRFTLIRWIYIATVIVITASFYKQGNKMKAVGEMFRLSDVRV